LSGFCQRVLPVFISLLVLPACGVGGTLSKADADPSLVTGAVPVAQSVADTTETSDANTVRNAISAAVLDGTGSVPLAWANRETGSRGTVSGIAETDQDGLVCRKFETSRESFEGIALYKGNTCLGADGQWSMLEFAPL
jgi:surface antigen